MVFLLNTQNIKNAQALRQNLPDRSWRCYILAGILWVFYTSSEQRLFRFVFVDDDLRAGPCRMEFNQPGQG